MQIVQRQQREFAGTGLTIDAPPCAETAPPAEAAPIRCSVSCTLAEYMGLLRAHLGFVLRRRPAGQRMRQTWIPLALAALAALAAGMRDPGGARNACAAIGVLAVLALPVTLDFWVVLVAPPVYFLKRRRVPACELRIDGRGIEHTSRRGTAERRWSELRMVRRYRRGYLLVFAQGGMLIPFRCLNRQQLERLRAHIAARGQATPA